MIIIGEKINGAIPSVKAAIAERDAELIRQRAIAQDQAGAHYLDCAPSTATELEYDAMVWLLDIMQAVSDVPICIDSPNPELLKSGLAAILSALAAFDRLNNFAYNGLFDWTAIVYYVSGAGLFCFLAAQALEKRRWN